MKNIGSFISSVYNKFKSEMNDEKYRTISDLIDDSNDVEICKEYANPPDCGISKDLILFLADALGDDKQNDKAEWLRSEAAKIESDENKIAFYWLDNHTETEIQMMQKPKRKHLKQTIDQIVANPDLLNGNHSNVGFVVQGEESLRDIKKEGSGGYRCFFTLLPDGKSCVIIGLSSGKSTTDVPKTENDHFLKLAKQTQANFDVASADRVDVITESMIGLCISECHGTRAIVESIKFPDNSVLVTHYDNSNGFGGGNKFVVFFKKGLTQEKLAEKLKGTKESEVQDKIIDLILGNLTFGTPIKDPTDFIFCGYMIKD